MCSVRVHHMTRFNIEHRIEFKMYYLIMAIFSTIQVYMFIFLKQANTLNNIHHAHNECIILHIACI